MYNMNHMYLYMVDLYRNKYVKSRYTMKAGLNSSQCKIGILMFLNVDLQNRCFVPLCSRSRFLHGLTRP